MEPDDHIPAEQIAALAEGSLPAESREAILKHLSRCRSCMAAYVEAVRYRAAWLAAPEAFEPPEELVELGQQALAEATTGARPARPSPWRLKRLAAAAAGLAALVVALRMLLMPTLPPIVLPLAVSEPLATVAAESTGLFLPGATERAPRPRDAMRSGGGMNVHPRLDLAVESLLTLHRLARSARDSARTAYPCAAALRAREDLEDAHDMAIEALKPGGNPCAARVLLAEILFRKGEDARAEGALTQAIHDGCDDDVTRMDWALVKASRGDTVEANPVFRQYSARRDALGERARSELGSHD
jgi:hypothetical protein